MNHGLHAALQFQEGTRMEILSAMLKIILAMVLGFFLYKRRILNDHTNEGMSRLITMSAAPCMIFSSVMSLDAKNRSMVYLLLIAGVVLYFILAVIAFIAARIIVRDKANRGSYEAMMTFGNAAFLAFPIGQALMGDVGVSFLAILNMHQNVFAFSYGVFQLTKGGTGKMKFSVKKLLNPPIIAAIIALVLFLVGVRVPEVINQPINFIGQLCSPLSMIVMGATIASYPFRNIFTNWRYYAASLVKLLIVPLIIFAIAYQIWGVSTVTEVLVIHCSMPTAVIVSMIAIMYGADYQTTSSATGLMDILCIGTIPAMWAFIHLFV